MPKLKELPETRKQQIQIVIATNLVEKLDKIKRPNYKIINEIIEKYHDKEFQNHDRAYYLK